MAADQAITARRTAALAMWAFLAGEVLMFGGLFMALAVCRWLNPDGWLASSAHLHLWLGTANTALLLTSSLTMALAVGAARRGRDRDTALLLGATAALGLAFLGVKGTEYWLEYRDGLLSFAAQPYALAAPGARLFFQLYLLATGLHALHLALGCLGGGGLALLAAQRGAGGTATEMMGLYWHFVDVVWVFLFPIFYLAAPR